MTRPAGNHSISPASGYYGSNWPSNGAIPQSFSMGGWTSGNLGFVQQTFLGASIRSFTMNGGFGDSSSQLSVELVNDEYNQSDKTDAGLGDDVYHSGQYDMFAPPPVGSPVFFKFGTNLATVEEAYKTTFDNIYKTSTIVDYLPKIVGTYDKNNFTTLSDGQYVNIENNTIIDNSEFLNSSSRGKDHLIFGGILQSYVQNRGPQGNPLYSVQVVDPREILANTILILNNYAGTIYQHSNMFNIYGFLEYNPTESLSASLSGVNGHYPYRSILQKTINSDGSYSFSGNDMFTSIDGLNTNYDFSMPENVTYDFNSNFPPRMPITGTGYARRSSQGIPYYRIRQGLNALLGVDGPLPQEYITAGFGGYINFRGFNYVLDLSGLKNLEDYYFFDFDQINLLDLCLEICDITSSDLFVSLLPIIDHPSCKRFYDRNNAKMMANKPKEIIAGIIRVDAIDRSKQPEYGAIKKYIDSLSSSGIFVENQDVGFELSNVTTDKFIVGAQEVDMYYFSANADRDDLEVRKQKSNLPNKANTLLGEQWTLDTSLKQQILPYYGLLGNQSDRAVTIPKGFGAYQQILLDATSLSANGVGNYYVATELELRTALISYERWVDFLLMYNDNYMESFESDDAFESAVLVRTPNIPANAPNGVALNPNISNNYCVTVPRSVFDTDQDNKFGDDDLPSSPCNPPYGYPLYYKRATKIGIPSAGLAGIQSTYNTILTNLAQLSGASTDDDFKAMLKSQWSAYQDGTGPNGVQSQEEQDYYAWVNNKIQSGTGRTQDTIGLIENTLTGLAQSFKIIDRLSKKTKENSIKVYNFVKQVAEECLGKKFLVKIPKEVNLFYSSNLQIKNNDPFLNEYVKGPFGFRPRSTNYDPAYEYSNEFKTLIQTQVNRSSPYNNIQTYLTKEDNIDYSLFQGALKGNWNAISETYEFNYEPNKQGGYINFDLLENVSSNKSLGVAQGLIPQDMKNFLNENNRMSAYVRFDNSQCLALDNLSPDSFTQQAVVAGHYIPDIIHELDNIKPDKFISFPAANNSEQTPKPKTVAFVKCDIDDKFYIAPKTKKKSIKVGAQYVKDIGKYSKPTKIYNCSTNSYDNSFAYYQAHYIPTTQEGSSVTVLEFNRTFNSVLNGNIIDTEESNLDTDHVYALITLPARISPTMDLRFKDSTFQDINPAVYKHILSLDVIKNLPGFDIPTFHGRPTNTFADWGISVDPQTIDYAQSAYNAATRNLKFSFPQRVNAAVPSPVYPDLVVLPLMSKERCYGPWVSSQSDVQAKVYQNIAGKVDFIKDENLAPWNFSGYQLMNAAGILQAEFSNSLLLQTERGGFVIPSAPFGISLGKTLLDAGPLVTNIAVDVSNNGVSTTCKMDLYTAKFGKLQKQKQDMISKISRERQKLQDERNALIRKGLGKNATSFNFQRIYNNLSNVRTQLKDGLPDIFNPNDSIMVGSVTASTNTGITGRTVSMYGDAGSEITSTSTSTNVSFQSPESISDVASSLDPLALAQEHYNSAGTSLASMYYPAAKEVAHNNMPHVYNPNIVACQRLYKDSDNNFGVVNDKDITIYEV